jgi:mRNA interferase RelE/StbE
LAYEIAFKGSVAKDLKKLDPTDARRILDRIAEELSGLADSLPGLKGRFAGLRKYRIGDYRVVFAILDRTILITRIRHRRDVYRD